MSRIIPIHYKKLVCVFKKVGFTYARTKGDHLIYTKPGVHRPLVILIDNEVPVFAIKNLIDTAGLSRKEYLALLKKC